MKISNCGVIVAGGKLKFVVTDDDVLYFGLVTYHKDLGNFFEGKTVIGAGTIPNPLSPIDNEEAWGRWQSTGYGVTTEKELRTRIYEALKGYSLL